MKPQRTAPLTAPLIYADRLFPADFATRAVARRLYAEVRDLPIVSPHGHTDPRWYAENAPFPDPARLFVTPDHYIFRMLYSQGVTLEEMGIPRKDGHAVETDARKIWRTFAEHYHLFRGTPTRLWLDQSFTELFGMTVRLSAKTADHYFDRISECLAKPEFRPRALFEQFKIEVIATTESPLDPLEQPQGDRGVRLEGPRGHGLPARSGGRSGVRRLPRQSAEIRRSHALRHVLLARLSRSAPAAPRLFQAARRDLDRSRAPDGADRRSRAGRCRAAVRQGHRREFHRRRRRAVPRADADRDGAHEPRRRAGDADPSGLDAQPQSRRSMRSSAATWAPTSRPAPTMCMR